MLKKIVVFLCLFFFQFLVFSATTTRSGSGSVPEMAFRSWRVGRSPMGTDIGSDVRKSFITTTIYFVRWVRRVQSDRLLIFLVA